MNIQVVIDRAIKDPVFAAELAAKAGKASRALDAQEGGVLGGLPSGEEWEELLGEFAESPEELSQLLAVNPTADGAEFFPTTATTTTTITTYTTTTTLACTVTTTTTTTGTTLTTTTHVVEQ